MRPSAPDAARGDERGFTLIEVVMVISLLALCSAAMIGVFASVERSQSYSADRTEALDQLRNAVATMTKDVRQASSVSPTSTASHLELDTYILGVPQHVVYEASGTTLTRKIGSGAAQPIHVRLHSTSLFSYAPSVTDTQVVTITVQTTPKHSPDTTLALTAETDLRNRG